MVEPSKRNRDGPSTRGGPVFRSGGRLGVPAGDGRLLRGLCTGRLRCLRCRYRCAGLGFRGCCAIAGGCGGRGRLGPRSGRPLPPVEPGAVAPWCLRARQVHQRMGAGEGQEPGLPRPFDGRGEGALVGSAGSGLAPGVDFCPSGEVPPETGHILVVDVGDFVDAEGAHLPPPEEPAVTTPPPGTFSHGLPCSPFR